MTRRRRHDDGHGSRRSSILLAVLTCLTCAGWSGALGSPVAAQEDTAQEDTAQEASAQEGSTQGGTTRDDSTEATADATTVRARQADEELTIVDQTFQVSVDAPFEVRIELPAEIDPTSFDERSVLVVTSHRSIVDRFEMHETVAGELTRTEDTFDVSLDPADPDPNLLSITDGVVHLRIPTESLTRTAEALQLAQAGIHPIVFELRVRDRPVGEVTTYLNRLPTVPGTAGPLSVAFVMRQMTLPVIADDGTVEVGDTAREELDQLAEVLAALDAVPTTDGSGVPRGVLVEPSLVQAIVEDDPELATRLLPGLGNSDLVATTRLPLDPSAASAAGQDERFGDWLRDGEDALGSLVPNTAIDRSVVLVDDRVSTGGAELQRNLGAQLLVLPWDFYTELDGSLDELTDISQLLTVRLSEDDDVRAAVVDDFLGNQMVRGADEPLRMAVQIAAELVVLARDLDIDGRAVENHGVVLALPDMGVPDPAFVSRLAALLQDTGIIRLVEPRELGTTTTTLLDDGRVVELELPDSAGPDLRPRIERLEDVSTDVLAYASMLPADSPDIARWSATLDAFPSTALDDDQADATIERLQDDFAELRDAIVAPEPFSFTLTGKDNDFRFALTNTSDTEITVRVRLNSPKIRFPDGERLVTLPPGVETNVVVNAEALSNGKSSVFLRLYAPAENRDVQLVPEVVLTARVNSLAGLGQLATGAGLLLVVTWWVHHARTSRRRVVAGKHQSRHPAAAAHRQVPAPREAPDPAPEGEVSPDAAASSLPPS